MRNNPISFAVLSLTVILLTSLSCSVKPPSDRLSATYGKVVKEDWPDRNPVIVIPGILGSKLYDPKTEAKIWGIYAAGSLSPNSAKGARQFALPMKYGKPLSDSKDQIIPNGALDTFKISILPGLKISSKAYAQILGVLGAGGYVDETLTKAKAYTKREGKLDYGERHFSCFQFDYDWRLSNVENASSLHEFIKEKKEFVRKSRLEKYGRSGPVKFDIVAHSMGGLLARYYLRYGDQSLPAKGLPQLNWKGAKDVEKVVVIGAPNFGSPDSLFKLCDGFRVAPLITPKYARTLLGTMPSIYELLPRTRHNLVSDNGKNVDLFDLETWKRYEWGLVNPESDKQLKQLLPHLSSREERYKVAEDHLAKCLAHTKRFHQALDRPAKPPKHLKLIGWVGDSGETLTYLKAVNRTVKAGAKGPGDQTVPRYSAIADERGVMPQVRHYNTPIYWSDVNYIYKNHLGMTKDISFADNLLSLLLEQGSSVSLTSEN